MVLNCHITPHDGYKGVTVDITCENKIYFYNVKCREGNIYINDEPVLSESATVSTLYFFMIDDLIKRRLIDPEIMMDSCDNINSKKYQFTLYTKDYKMRFDVKYTKMNLYNISEHIIRCFNIMANFDNITSKKIVIVKN